MSSIKKLHGVNVPINNEDPMDGLFAKIFKHINIVDQRIVIVNQSSKVSNYYSDAICLIERNENKAWLSEDKQNQYFDLYFPFFYVELSGYAMMQQKNNDEITRSWKVSCVYDDDTAETILHEVVDSSIFCDGKTGYEVFCGRPDKKAFNVSKTRVCNKIKFANTGLNSRGGYNLGLSGVELFGKIIITKRLECTKMIAKRCPNMLTLIAFFTLGNVNSRQVTSLSLSLFEIC